MPWACTRFERLEPNPALLEQWLFALDDLHQVTEERLYDQLMEEFPSWIREASAKGIIG
ncbi:VWA domain-containing protein [Pseudomonas aeruginosa]|uniref:VWA domain-containing protein n=1 Tax=Pseudomonas aeruginosa TaxID=287 RepID=A0AAQ3R4W1_PSEAI|nr:MULTISPECIES: VWA domain-containing protein [Pseudomonas]MDQ2359025.1 VWA domain-containing protein [Pseudomonas aeruginosa]MDQ2413244.1 VWA domain-containing protein [Pseudomonas aeruginosa]MDQ2476772.1 VWA domain-containing protein [Pseudomonas aeruginosa]MDQ2511162.1 VWA domain-containing protein [Pseudomonas aeruginosa]MDQ2581306.1 VWA domain-containing protein [Pseudomonas aeruginosa]